MKKLLSLLLAICLMCVPIQTIHAQEPVDIIYDIINKDDHKKSGLDLINSIIGKDSKVDKEKVKVIKNKRELDKEIKESKKKDNKKTEKRQLKGIDVSKWNLTKATSFNSLFKGCGTVKKLDVSNWKTS